jgi:tRNA G10  N-methylase Trm11
MMTWNELKDINIKPHRKPELEKEYLIFRNNNKNCDYIKSSIFTDKTKELYLTTNKFPYDLEDNILHLIIWDFKPFDNEKKNKTRYRNFIKKFFNPKNFDIILRVNKPEHQSIPEFKHCHLFLKIKKIS